MKFVFAGLFMRNGGVSGIQTFSFDEQTKALSPIGTFGQYSGMSTMVLDGSLMIANVEGADAREIVSFRIGEDGSLEELSALDIGCTLIAHLFIIPSSKLVLAASMGGGCVVLVKYSDDGTMQLLDKVLFDDPGSFTVGASQEKRQGGSRVHSAFLMPGGKYINVCNFGADKLYTLALDAEKGTLTFLPERTFSFEGGEGPRHIAYSADGRFAYVNTELGCKIHVFAIGEDSRLERIQVVSSQAPGNEDVTSQTSLVALTKDGRFLICGNRGADDIVSFAVGEDGKLTFMSSAPCCGNGPRGVAFGFDDEFILVGNNGSGNAAVIGFDKETGKVGECLQLVEDVPGAANVIPVEL